MAGCWLTGQSESTILVDILHTRARARKHKLTLLEIKLLDASLVRSNSGTLDADIVLLDGLCRIERHLVVGLVTIRQAKVKVLEVNVEVRMDEAVLDVLPDDARHFVTINLDKRILDLDPSGRRHGASDAVECGRGQREGQTGW